MAEERSAAATSSKVQEVAENMQELAGKRKRISPAKAEGVARRYFEAIDARDLDGAVALWSEGGREHVRGQLDVFAPEGVRAFISELLAAFPDLQMKVVTTTAQGERCAVHWHLHGTFAGPGGFGGIGPTGSVVDLEGCDLLTVKDGLIQANDAFTDSMSFAREIGMMPAKDSPAEQRMTGAFNAKTRVADRLAGGDAELVAQGVWLVQGRLGHCNVYLIEDDGQVTVFDAGTRSMTRSVATAAARLGGIRRIVLGHGHVDHRGAAPGLGAPVVCHPDEVQDAEGSGGWRYWPADLKGLPFPVRPLHRLMVRHAFDGGPVEISGTVKEGEEIAGFTVIEIPGHAPGQIALWRESDRLAITSDAFYTMDLWGRAAPAQLPDAVYNYDSERARASLRKLAALEPAVAWPGHTGSLSGDVRGELERAAEAP
jgi:glyoxylase-like metal-dependent hydrolase (beta-lactamase superfamily II)/predicted ester cyclase